MTRGNPYVPASAFAGHQACMDSAKAATAPPLQTGHRATLVVTRLAPGVGASVVADIFKRCRQRHARLAVTGAILFDGERLGVWCCGAAEKVAAAIEAIHADPLLVAPRTLVDADEVPPWAAQTWHAGWCEPDALAALTEADAPRGSAAIEAWRAVMAASDLL